MNKVVKKPVLKKHEFYDYHECAEYIAKKLGKKNLRDCGEKHCGKKDLTAPYQDFWHYLIETNDINNGCLIVGIGLFNGEALATEENSKWSFCIPILKAFEDEFGPNAQYWVEW